jgi:hypothetical protein
VIDIEKDVLEERKCVLESESSKYFGTKFECYKTKYLRTKGVYVSMP